MAFDFIRRTIIVGADLCVCPDEILKYKERRWANTEVHPYNR